MGSSAGFYNSTIGKKIIVGTTGLFLCLYLIVHLAGNLLLFNDDNGAAFDAYAEFLPSLLIIRIIEIVLFIGFAIHILGGTVMWILNKRARPVGYTANRPSENSSFFSRTMFLTGSIVFIFLVVHMWQFWYPSRFMHTETFSMYRVVMEAFANPFYAGFYVIAMGLLGFHLRHGFQSAWQTFGIRHWRYGALIEAIGVFFWLIIPLGFAAMPIYFFFRAY